MLNLNLNQCLTVQLQIVENLHESLVRRRITASNNAYMTYFELTDSCVHYIFTVVVNIPLRFHLCLILTHNQQLYAIQLCYVIWLVIKGAWL